MRTRQLVTTLALAGGLLAAPALPAQAAPTGGCPSASNNTPVLTLALNPTLVRGTEAAVVSGTFKNNSCAITNANIRVQSRPLVNGKPAGVWKNVATATTNTKGVWRTSYAPGVNVRVRAVFPAAGAFPRTMSPVRTLLDAIRITMHATTPPGCKIHLTGSTTPVQVNRTVSIQSRGAVGHFQGWTSIGTTKTHSDGTYSTTAVAKCGTTYNLRVRIGASSTNEAGHSGTTFGIRPHH